MKINESSRYFNFLIRLLTILIAVWPALYNGFPLVTSDTGTYIHSGLTMSLPIDRPWAYGIFILISSFHTTLWGVILWQGIIFTWLIKAICQQIWGKDFSIIKIALITIFISFGTAAAWINSQLMADFFTSMLLLSLLLLYLKIKNKESHFWLYSFILFCTLTHNSNMLILLGGSIILGIYSLLQKNKTWTRVNLKLLALSLFAVITVSFMNFVKFKTFSLSPGSHLFMISRLAEQDLLDLYLDKTCETKDYELCKFKGEFGNRQWDFMWHNEQLPHFKDNGWLASKKEYSAIVKGILTDPKLLSLFILKSIESTGKQLTQIYIGEGMTVLVDNQQPYPIVKKFFNHQLKEYRSSFQHQGVLNFGIFNWFSIILSLFTCFSALFLSQRKTALSTKSQISWQSIFGITILFIVLNAFITANLSTITARLNIRAFWILPFISLLYCIDKLNIFQESKKI